MRTPASRRFLSEWGTFAAVLVTLAGVAWALYRVLAKVG